MRPLTPAEFQKPNSQTGEPRLELLVKAIISGTPLPTVDKKTVFLANDPENLKAVDQFKKETKPKPMSLKTKEGDSISSSKLGKSAYFGGGKGAGGGTDNTAVVESAQCLWLAAMLKHGANQPIEYYTPEVLKSFMGKVSVGKTSFDDMISIDPTWAYSSYYSAKKLIAERYVNSNHIFHRDSKEMKFIYDAKKTALKNSGLGSMSDDKWNPGDIWAIESGVNLSKELDISSISSLNSSLLKLFTSRKVIGISLKQVKKDPAKIKEYNFESAPSSHKFISAKTKSNRGDFFSNKGGFIEFSSGLMDIRPNSYMGTNKIEIRGTNSRGGGAGWQTVVYSAKKYMNVKVRTHAETKKLANKILKGDKRAIQIFFLRSKICDSSLTYDYFAEQIKEKDGGWITAKIGAVDVCSVLIQKKGTKSDAFINSIVNYAASTSEESSVFIKVSQ